MINLFHLNNHTIDTSRYSNLLHDNVVTEFENTIAEYVGAKYAVALNSATSAIFLALQDKQTTISVPSMIPPVVLNAIITSGNDYTFNDNTDWVGDSYTLVDFGDYKIIDSAQKLEYNQFTKECDDVDLMVFSFYPTKPVGSCDGGMIVSNDKSKIDFIRTLALNGMTMAHNNWERVQQMYGFKMYMNSIQCEIALKNFQLYESKLHALDNVRRTYNEAFDLTNTSNHLYRVEVDSRGDFMQFMKDNGIGTGVHYEAAHTHPILGRLNSNCPLSEIKSKRTVSIPLHERLTNSEIKFIISKIKEYNERHEEQVKSFRG
jgi:dTDP-4-amino-4,6-dideoxygalactose transaminase